MKKLTSLDTDSVADRLLADYDAVRPQSLFAEGFRLELADAWQVQAAVARLREKRGERVIGYKVGAVTPGNQKMMGLPHPVWGRLWDSEVYENGASLSKSSYANIAIEAEFAITLSADLPADCTISDIAESVDAVYPTLELHNLVMGSEQPHGPELVANNCINCGVVKGSPVTDLSTQCDTDLKLIYDGQIIDQWQSLRWPDNLVAAVTWLANTLHQHNLKLNAGDLILTSAWGPPVAVGDATRVDVTSSAFGSVSARFE